MKALSNKQQFNLQFGFKRDESHSLAEVAKKTRISKAILQEVFNRGVGAWKSNPTSVRSQSGAKSPKGFPVGNRMSKDQWAYARVYGFVMRNPKQVGKDKPDHDLFQKIK